MPDRFDPYRKWLGIPPADQPPDHYRLLGIGRFEDDLDTISNAADRQMAHVRTFQAGPNSALSQKLLNEISAARICLLNSAKKAEYDRVLRAKEASQPAPVVERSPPVVEGSPTTPLRPTEGLPTPAPPGLQPIPVSGFPSSPSPINLGGRPHSLRYAPPKKKLPALGIAVGGACLLAAVIAVIMVLNRGEPENTQPLARNLRDTDATPGKTSTDAAAPTQAGKPTAASDRAAPKLEIIKAEWGAGDRWQDITQRVRSLIYDERLVATAWGSFYAGVPDPEFGAPKHVRISYRAAGEPGEADLADGDFIYLDGRPPGAGQPSTAGLEIVEALYGAETTWFDVLPRVRRWVHDDRLAVRVGLVAQTDPAPGQRKALFVRYRKPDREFAVHAWDSEELALDARPLDAEGNPLVPPPAASSGEVVDLFKHIDFKLDAVAGDWQITDEGLLSPSGESVRLEVPYSPPDDYELRMVAARRSGNDSFFLGLLVDGRQTMLALDRFGGASSGLHLLDGEPTERNATIKQGRVFVDERPKDLVCTVHPSSVRVTCDDRLLVDWHGDARRLSLDQRLSVPDTLGLALGDWNTQFLISKFELRPLPPEPPTPPTDLSQPVDVLRRIDLARDVVYGEWRQEGAALIAPATQWARLQLPVIPPEAYTLTLETPDHRDIAVGIVVGARRVEGAVIGGRQVEVVLDGGPSGETSGLQDVGGQGGDRNPTTHQGKVLREGGPNTIVCTVLQDQVTVVCNGAPVIDWQGDPQSLSLPHASMMPDDRRPFLRGWDHSFRITRLELSAPDAAIVARRPPEPPAQPPRSLADLLDQAPAATDKRLPAPSGEALAKAEQKVETMFAKPWKTAKTLPDRLAVPIAIYNAGVQTNDEPVLRYALLREAGRRAAALGDVATACDAVERLGREFQTDPLADKLTAAGDALQKTRSPTQLATIAMMSLLLADRAMNEVRLDEARKFAKLAESAGRRARHHDLATAAEHQQTLVRRGQEQHAQLAAAIERLRQQPDDAEANRATGLYRCLVRGDWRRGLPLLARSGDAPLAEIARLEPLAGKDPSRRAALIDAWRAAAQTQTGPQTGPLRTECERQAKYWYDRGLPADALTVERLQTKAAVERLAGSGVSPARVVPGLDMAMFDGGDFQQFRARRVDAQIWHGFGYGSPDPAVPGDYFSIRWTGWLKAPAPGKYVIKTNSDDSIRVRIDGKLLIDHWGRGAGDEFAEVELTGQLQPLAVEYNDYQGGADIGVRWALKNISDLHVVPPEAFFHDPANRVGVRRATAGSARRGAETMW